MWTWCSVWEPQPPAEAPGWQELGLGDSHTLHEAKHRSGTQQMYAGCCHWTWFWVCPPKIREGAQDPRVETCLELVSHKWANCIQLHLPFCLFTHIPPLSPLSLTFAAINMGMMVWFCKSLVMLNALISRWPVLLLKPAATPRSPQPSSWTTGASESTGTAEHGWWTFECRVQQGRQRSTFTECRWPASLLQWNHASRIL